MVKFGGWTVEEMGEARARAASKATKEGQQMESAGPSTLLRTGLGQALLVTPALRGWRLTAEDGDIRPSGAQLGPGQNHS